VKSRALAEPRFYREFGAEVFHLLLHLINLSALAHSPPIAQLLMWLPAPRRVHKGHFLFCTLSFSDLCFTTRTPAYMRVLASLSCRHRCHARQVHLLSLCCRIAWNQTKAAFGKLDVRVSPRSSDTPWKVDGVFHFITEGPLHPTS